MKKSRTGIIVIIVFVIAALCLALFGPSFFTRKEVLKSVDVQKENKIPLSAKGVVESKDEIEIASQVASSIIDIRVDEGDTVKKGQLLVVFDDKKVLTKVKLAEASLREAKEHLRELESGYRKEDVEGARSNVNRTNEIFLKAKDEYERQNRLYEKDATTRIELERAQQKMNVAMEDWHEAKSNLQKLDRGARSEEIEQARAVMERVSSELQYNNAILSDYRILSPIDGVVSERFKDPGETVDFGNPVMRIITPKRLRIRAELEETDAGKIEGGEIVEVSSDAYRDRTFNGKVSKVFPLVKRKSLRTFDPQASLDISAQNIYIDLDDFTGLKDGMTVTVKFIKKK